MLMETKTQYWYPPPGNNEHTRNSKRVYKMVISARWTFWEWIKDTTGIHILLERNCLVERNCLLALQGSYLLGKVVKSWSFFFYLMERNPFSFSKVHLCFEVWQKIRTCLLQFNVKGTHEAELLGMKSYWFLLQVKQK